MPNPNPKKKKNQPPKPPSRLMRVLPVLLTTFFAVTTAVYCVSWYFQASFAKSNVTRAIADLNSDKPLITYSAIETSGFPLDVNVRVVQPKFSGRMDALFKNIQAASGAPASPDDAWQKSVSKLPEWVEEVAFAGSVNIGVNFFSDRYTVSVDGPVTHISVINQNRTTLITQPKGPLTCMLQLDRQSTILNGLWDITRMARSTPDELVHDFQAVDCSSPGFITTEEGTKETVMSGGPFQFRFINMLQPGNNRSVELSTKMIDYEGTQRMNSAINRYLALFADVPGTPHNTDIAAYGRQNVDIEFAMHGPAELRSFSEDSPFVVSVPRFEIHNALYGTSTIMRVENNVSAEARAINVVIHSESSFSKAYDKYLADYVRILVAQIRESDDPDLQDIKTAFGKQTVDQTVSLLEPIIPRLHSFGNIGMKINASLEGDKVLRKGKLNISNFDIATTPYGLALQGNATMPGEGKNYISGATFTLTCRNCLTMVDDSAHYVQRGQQILTSLEPSMTDSPQYASPELVQGVKSFLTALGDSRQDPATGAETLVFTLFSDASGNISLNGKSPQKVTQMYAASIAPYLPAPRIQEQSPAAGY